MATAKRIPVHDCKGYAQCKDTRQRDGYRHRTYQCAMCDKRWRTIEVPIADGPRPTWVAAVKYLLGLPAIQLITVAKFWEMARNPWR